MVGLLVHPPVTVRTSFGRERAVARCLATKTPASVLEAIATAVIQMTRRPMQPNSHRSIQDSLLSTHNIKLGWIRAHVGQQRNERADELAKDAILSTNATEVTIPLPKSSAKRDLKQRSLIKWQYMWDGHKYGRSTHKVITKVGLRSHNWPSELTQFITGHGPFPFYLYLFGKHPDDNCACGKVGTPIHYVTKCRLTLPLHLKFPAVQHREAWMISVTSRRQLINKIVQLLDYIIINEDQLKSDHPD
ncbi:hypothetical protein AVEN_244882-1 [Araneus ventricosus]|uniref:RNase H type-1 domain-containing protein n=1 Tax=Araneus ventricosus TaxID=182803 RepID=A0A4Y2KYY2_ARAVE|nr:hypothetical protein AVEN_244882-1 [Araneus ventricosus]